MLYIDAIKTDDRKRRPRRLYVDHNFAALALSYFDGERLVAQFVPSEFELKALQVEVKLALDYHEAARKRAAAQRGEPLVSVLE